MDTEYFAQHIQCSRMDKTDLLDCVHLLMELATHARDFGLLDLDRRMNNDPVKFSDPFLRKAINTVADISDPRLVRKVLYNYIVAGNLSGRHFLKSVVITETVIAIMLQQDLDYIFSFLVPSYFGVEFEGAIQQLYMEFKSTKHILE